MHLHFSLSGSASERDKNLDRGFYSVVPVTCLNHQLANIVLAFTLCRNPGHGNNHADPCFLFYYFQLCARVCLCLHVCTQVQVLREARKEHRIS